MEWVKDYCAAHLDKEIPLIYVVVSLGVRDYDMGIKSMDNGKNQIILNLIVPLFTLFFNTITIVVILSPHLLKSF
jgi:hypothetical protein